MKKRCNMSVVFSTDNEFAFPTSIALISLLENAKSNTFYEVFILIDNAFTDDNRNVLEEICDVYDNFKLQFIVVQSSIFEHATIKTSHITQAAYYRLIIPNLLQDYDKCFYSDGDVIFNFDLSELFELDISDYYFFGVKAYQGNRNSIDIENHRKLLNVDSMEKYVYSGDILINLKKIRDDKLVNVFIDHIGYSYPSEDQDVLNVCCYGKIGILPLKYTLLNRFYCSTNLLEDKSYTDIELSEAYLEPAIIHYAGRDLKPWKNFRCKAAGIWWEYAEKSPRKDIYEKVKNNSIALTKNYSWSNLLEECIEFDDVVIFGFSEIGRCLYDNLRKSGIQSVKCFADNCNDKQGLIYDAIPVYSKEKAVQNFSEALYVVSSQVHYNQIKNELLKSNVPEKCIRIFFEKNMIYYMGIDPKYYLDELKDVYIKEYGIDKYSETSFDAFISEINSNKQRLLIDKYYMTQWYLR